MEEQEDKQNWDANRVKEQRNPRTATEERKISQDVQNATTRQGKGGGGGTHRTNEAAREAK